MLMADLAKQVVWVTGAGSGIGEAAAATLAAAGATVVLTGRRCEPLEAVAAGIVAAGGKAAVEPGDLTDAARVEEIARGILSRFGRLDVLVNNAGVNIRDRATASLKPEGVDTLLSTNLAAAFYCVTSVLPIFRGQGGGLMIHTASWLGRHSHKLAGAGYSAAKHAVVGLTKAAAVEYSARHIRINAIAPGWVITERQRDLWVTEESLAAHVARQCIKQVMRPDDIVGTVLFLASDASRLLTAQMLIVDGGFL